MQSCLATRYNFCRTKNKLKSTSQRVFQVTAILSWIVRSWTDVENNIVSVERVNEYADTAKEVSVFT